MNFEPSKAKSILLAAMLSATLTGCGGDSSDSNTGNDNSGDNSGRDDNSWSATITTDNMDASNSDTIAVYDLSSGVSTTVNDMDSYSGDWQFSYQKHRKFHTNSGSSGTGNNAVEIESCIAYEYPDLFDAAGEPVQAELEKLDASNTLAKFEELDFEACADFTKDELATSTQIGSDWYAYANFSISIPEGTKGWIVKSADDSYARITPKEYNSGLVFSVETWNGASWDSALDTPAIDYYSGSNAYYDFNTNTAGTEDTQGWDLYFKNTNHLPEIIIAPDAGVAYYYDNNDQDAFTYESVDQIDNPVSPTGAALYKWFENDTKGALRGPGDLGAIEMIGYTYFPTYTTYLIKEGTSYHKVQILGYKGTDGAQDSGNIVVRYASKTVE
jgi:hypothetical protein